MLCPLNLPLLRDIPNVRQPTTSMNAGKIMIGNNLRFSDALHSFPSLQHHVKLLSKLSIGNGLWKSLACAWMNRFFLQIPFKLELTQILICRDFNFTFSKRIFQPNCIFCFAFMQKIAKIKTFRALASVHGGAAPLVRACCVHSDESGTWNVVRKCNI